MAEQSFCPGRAASFPFHGSDTMSDISDLGFNEPFKHRRETGSPTSRRHWTADLVTKVEEKIREVITVILISHQLHYETTQLLAQMTQTVSANYQQEFEKDISTDTASNARNKLAFVQLNLTGDDDTSSVHFTDETDTKLPSSTGTDHSKQSEQTDAEMETIDASIQQRHHTPQLHVVEMTLDIANIA